MRTLELCLTWLVLGVFGYFMYSQNASGLIGSTLTLCSGALLQQILMNKNHTPTSYFKHEDRCPNCGDPCNVDIDLDEADYCNNCRKISYEIQYSPNRDVVWVHCSTGETVGRFSTKFGMDIHTTVEEQMSGKPQCLRCTHGRPTKKDFDEFCEKAKDLWGVTIDQSQLSF